MTSRVHPSAELDEGVRLGTDVQVWQQAHVRAGAVIGDHAVLGRGVYVGPGVRVGANCKIQNYALVYEPAVLDDGVFIGPAVVLTNDLYPRAVNPDGSRKSADDWAAVGVTVREGASIGARSVCVAPVTIGRWALVAAGSTVIADVPDFALVVGSPARRIRWVGRAGVPLDTGDAPDRFRCPRTGATYRLAGPDVLMEEERA